MKQTTNEAIDLLFSAFCAGENFSTDLEAEREKAFAEIDDLLTGTEQGKILCEKLLDFQYIALKSGFVSGFMAAKDLLR